MKLNISFTKCSYAVMVVGVFLRAWQYFYNRSIWLDEAIFANTLVHPLSHLLSNSGGEQLHSPIGYFYIQQFIFKCFGYSEMALRFLPFIAGILSIFLVYKVARYFVSDRATLLVVTLFCFSRNLVYFATELKQYSLDVFLGLGLFYVVMPLFHKNLSWRRALLLGVLGAVALVCSHPSVFILASLGCVLLINRWRQKKWMDGWPLVSMMGLWAMSFGLVFYVALKNLSNNDFFVNFWQGYFFPLSLSSEPLIWVINRSLALFEDPGSFMASGLALCLYLLGIMLIFRRHKQHALLLTLPLFFAFVACVFQKYPFGVRLLLYYVPFMYILIAQSVDDIWIQTKANLPSLTFLIIGVLIYHSVLITVYGIKNPGEKVDLKACLEYILDREEEGDHLYVFWGVEPPFKFYAANQYDFSGFTKQWGRDYRMRWDKYLEEIESLPAGRRVWLLFGHLKNQENIFFQSILDKRAKRLNQLYVENAAVLLYQTPKE